MNRIDAHGLKFQDEASGRLFLRCGLNKRSINFMFLDKPEFIAHSGSAGNSLPMAFPTTPKNCDVICCRTMARMWSGGCRNLVLQFRARTTERQVAQFVDDQKIKFVQPFQHAIQRELLLRFFQLIDQRRSREELRS